VALNTSTNISITNNWIQVYTNSNTTDDQCDIVITNGNGGHTITGNTMIQGIDSAPTTVSCENIYIGTEGVTSGTIPQMTIANNFMLYDAPGTGTLGNTVGAIYYRNCHSNRLLIYNNVIVMKMLQTDIFTVIGGNSGYHTSLRLYNNTIYTDCSNYCGGLIVGSYVDTLDVKNNIFDIVHGNANIIWFYTALSTFASQSIDYNRYYYGGNTIVINDNNTNSYSWTTWQGMGYDQNSSVGTVSFSNAGGDNAIDYKLNSGSAGIDAGATIPLTSPAYDGTVRSQGTAYDIGAFEYSSGVGGGGGGTLPTSTLNLTALIEALYVAGGTAMSVSPWVTVELHNSTTPYALVDSNSAALSPAGAGIFTFTKAVSGTNYYLVVKSVNTIAIWSASPQSFISSALSYNFTTAVTQAYTDGSNPPLALHNGKYCIYSGDLNQDGFINKADYTGVDNDNSTFNYHSVNDLNGDGFVTTADDQFIDNNYIILIHKQVPAGAQ
jgi:hypothetical protein